MPRESLQSKIGRVRPPRVQITYDVETGGAITAKQIPFVVGVLADLSGQPEQPLPRLENRKFDDIDRDNLDLVMAKHKPRLVMQVDNRLTAAGGKLSVELEFKKLADFHPENVAQNYKPLRELVELRSKLSNLRTQLSGNNKLQDLLQEAVRVTQERMTQQDKSREEGPDGN